MLTTEINDNITITVTGKFITISEARLLLERLKETADGNDKNIVIDLGMVELVDSSTIAMLVEFRNYLKNSGREITLENPTPFVKKIFDMLHMSKIFGI